MFRHPASYVSGFFSFKAEHGHNLTWWIMHRLLSFASLSRVIPVPNLLKHTNLFWGLKLPWSCVVDDFFSSISVFFSPVQQIHFVVLLMLFSPVCLTVRTLTLCELKDETVSLVRNRNLFSRPQVHLHGDDPVLFNWISSGQAAVTHFCNGSPTCFSYKHYPSTHALKAIFPSHHVRLLFFSLTVFVNFFQKLNVATDRDPDCIHWWKMLFFLGRWWFFLRWSWLEGGTGSLRKRKMIDESYRASKLLWSLSWGCGAVSQVVQLRAAARRAVMRAPKHNPQPFCPPLPPQYLCQTTLSGCSNGSHIMANVAVTWRRSVWLRITRNW